MSRSTTAAAADRAGSRTGNRAGSRTAASRTVSRTGARPALSRELIGTAALQLTAGSGKPLTLSALGRSLGADPTAIYRHYRSRDELLLDLADLLCAEVERRCETHDDWREQLAAWARAMRETYLEHPALAIEVSARFTGGPNEQAGVDRMRACLLAAGFGVREANGYIRGLAELVLGHIGLTATLLTLPADLQKRDVTIGLQVYPDPDQGPTTNALVDERLATAREDEDAVFALLLATYLEGVAARLHP